MPPTPPQGNIGPDHMLPAHKRSGAGPTVGIVIILILLGFGALYFWGASMNREQEQLPFIPGDSIF
ncbi:hypothetical protein A3C21_04485 [Candidatus Kaiserbacteria bacterium RIFCSPHIGHO2_02_FULL_59_21]|uniref:Uncharacterized protein n=1 Tax=Candidatus Kaiserbacteria bacterium RIFCSPHIGHO2_02_FULL_59_21 TaxID=1798500 RepID=A0A1F6E0B5_9BACT|nr:MAG: hypothetical protein A3C21_04485 [Candidatus Kaiserbacteria bacterium RIFCSPHIGHO2_02_FULL_59_21]